MIDDDDDDDDSIAADQLRVVHLLSNGEPSAQASRFADGFTLLAPGELLLMDGAALLHERLSREPPLDAPDEPMIVVLGADRWDIAELCERTAIAAAIEKYALFMWTKHHGDGSPGAFWIHGDTQIALSLGPDIVLSPLYRTATQCAFGSATATLPELLARYLEAWSRARQPKQAQPHHGPSQ
jgi:hypothetical protein